MSARAPHPEAPPGGAMVRLLLFAWLLPGWALGLAASAYVVLANRLWTPHLSDAAVLMLANTLAGAAGAGGMGLALLALQLAARGRAPALASLAAAPRFHAALAAGVLLAWVGVAPTTLPGGSDALRAGLRTAAPLLGALLFAAVFRLGPRLAARPALARAGRGAVQLGAALALLATALLAGVAAGGRALSEPPPSAEGAPPWRFPALDPPLARDEGRGRVIALGIDGLHWELVEPLIEAGLAPNFERVRQSGATAVLESMLPTWSPVIWTTVATGRAHRDHGVSGFTVTHYPDLGLDRIFRSRPLALTAPLLNRLTERRVIPVSSQDRRVKAIWNLASEAGLRVAVTGWWASWPAEVVDGFVVSDHAYYALLDDKLESGVINEIPGEQQTFPPSLLAELSPFQRPLDSARPEDLDGFVQLTDEDRRHFRDHPDWRTSDPTRAALGTLVLALMKDRFFGESALHLWDTKNPDLLLMYLNSVDMFGHQVYSMTVPDARELGHSEEDIARYGDSMRAVVRWMDAWLGRLLERVDENTTLVVLSDHGFERTGSREGRRAFNHDNAPPGVFLAVGAHVRKGVRLERASIRDVTPTILYLAGLPLSDELEGEVLTGALDPDFVAAHPPRRVPTYEAGPPRRGSAPGAGEDEEMLENLRALGYIE